MDNKLIQMLDRYMSCVWMADSLNSLKAHTFSVCIDFYLKNGFGTADIPYPVK